MEAQAKKTWQKCMKHALETSLHHTPSASLTFCLNNNVCQIKVQGKTNRVWTSSIMQKKISFKTLISSKRMFKKNEATWENFQWMI
jgi:hypothetical protein